MLWCKKKSARYANFKYFVISATEFFPNLFVKEKKAGIVVTFSLYAYSTESITIW